MLESTPRRLCAGFFDFYMGVIYGHTFNTYSREWSSYFTLPMVTNELHWHLVNLIVKSHFNDQLFFYGRNVK